MVNYGLSGLGLNNGIEVPVLIEPLIGEVPKEEYL